MSDWIEQIDIAGDRYDLKDLQTEALAQQNEQNIETLENKSQFIIRTIQVEPYSIVAGGYATITIDASHSGYKLLSATCAHSGYAEGIPFGVAVSSNSVTLRIKNLNNSAVSGVTAAIQCLYQKI